jgi:transketolase
VGGAADLAPSTKTRLTFDGAGDFGANEPTGRNMHFGVREHAMSAVLNGLSLSKLRPYGSGFLIFSDYARPAIRLSALMEIPVIYIFTHDSIGVGEDARPISRWSIWRRSARSPDSSCCDRRTPTRWSKRGGSSWRFVISRSRSC